MMTFLILINLLLVIFNYDSIIHFCLYKHPSYDSWFSMTQLAMVLSFFRTTSYAFEGELPRGSDCRSFSKLVFSQFWNGNLKIISDQDQSSGGFDNLNDYFEFLEYLFYPPTFFLGPVITYDSFDSPPKDLVPTQSKLTTAIIE